jgi:hypothetical protein
MERRGEMIYFAIFVATLVLGTYIRFSFWWMTPNEFIENVWIDILIGGIAAILWMNKVIQK